MVAIHLDFVYVGECVVRDEKELVLRDPIVVQYAQAMTAFGCVPHTQAGAESWEILKLPMKSWPKVRGELKIANPRDLVVMRAGKNWRTLISSTRYGDE